MTAMTERMILDSFAQAAERQSKAIESMIDELRAVSSFEGKLLIDIEGLDEAFGVQHTPQIVDQKPVNLYAIRA